MTALAYREEGAHPEFLHVPFFEDCDRQRAVIPGQRFRGIGEVRRRADIRGRIAQVLRGPDAHGDGHAIVDGTLYALLISLFGRVEVDMFQREAVLGRLAPHFIELIAARIELFHQPPGRPVNILVFDADFQQAAERGFGFHRLQRADDRVGHLHEPGVIQGIRFAQARQNDPRRVDARHFMKDDGLSAFALQVAPFEHSLYVAVTRLV